jgi:hypothetical protein
LPPVSKPHCPSDRNAPSVPFHVPGTCTTRAEAVCRKTHARSDHSATSVRVRRRLVMAPRFRFVYSSYYYIQHQLIIRDPRHWFAQCALGDRCIFRRIGPRDFANYCAGRHAGAAWTDRHLLLLPLSVPAFFRDGLGRTNRVGFPFPNAGCRRRHMLANILNQRIRLLH